MASQGEVKIILSLDINKANAEFKRFVTNLKKTKPGDPFKPLDESFKKLSKSMSSIGSKGLPGLGKIGSSAKKTAADLKHAGTSVTGVGRKIKAVGAAAKAGSQGFTTLSQAITRSQQPSKATANAVGTLATKIRALGSTTTTLSALPVSFNKLAKSATKSVGPLEKVKKKLLEVGKRGTESTNKLAKGFSNAVGAMDVGGIGMAIGTAVLAPLRELGNVIPQAVAEFTALDGSIRLTLGIAGEASDKFGQLQTAILTVGASTAATTQEVAEVAQSLARAGQSLEEIEQSLDPIVRGAEATGTTYGDMGNIVVAALGQFRLEAADTADVVDTLTVAANSSNQTVSDLGEALKYVGPVAAGAGQTLQNVSIALEILANNGIKASSAGTSLRTLLTNLQIASAGAGEEFTSLSRGSARLSKAMRTIGAEVTDAHGQLLEMPVLLKSLRDGMTSLDTGERAIISKVLAGSEGLPTLNSLMSATDAQIDELADGMENRMGAASKAQAKAMQGLFGATKELNSAMSAALAHIGSIVAIGFEPLLRVLKLVFDVFRAIPSPIKDIMVGLALLGATIGIVAIAMTILKTEMVTTFAAGIITNIQNIVTALKAFNTANIVSNITNAASAIKLFALSLGSNLAKAVQLATVGLNAFNAAFAANNALGLAGAIKSAVVAAFAAMTAGTAASTGALVTHTAASGAASTGNVLLGTTSVGAAAGIGTLWVALAPLLPLIAAVAAAVAVLTAVFFTIKDGMDAYSESGKEAFAANEKLAASMDTLEEGSKKARDGLNEVEDGAKDTFKAQEDLWQMGNRLFNPFDTSAIKAIAASHAVRASTRDMLNEFRRGDKIIGENEKAMEGLSETSDKYISLASKNADIAYKQRDAIKGRIAWIDKEINSTKKRDWITVQRLKTLAEEKKKLEGQLPVIQAKVEKYGDEEKRVKALKGETVAYVETIGTLTRAYQDQQQKMDTKVQAGILKNTVAVRKGLKLEEEALASNTAMHLQASNSKIDAMNIYIAGLGQQVDDEGNLYEKASNMQAQTTEALEKELEERAELEKQLTAEVLAAIDARMGKYMEEVQAIASGYEQLGSMVSTLNGLATSSVSAFKSLADSITSYDMAQVDRVKDARLRAIGDEKNAALSSLDVQKAAALRAAGDNASAKKAIERDYNAKRKEEEIRFQNMKKKAEAEAAAEKKRIMTDALQFELKMANATLEIKRAEIEMAHQLAQIKNEIAIQENMINIEKAKAAGASERELVALQNIGTLLNANTNILDTQKNLQLGIAQVQNETTKNQIATKAETNGINMAISGQRRTIEGVNAGYEAMKGKITEASRELSGIGENLQQLPNEVNEISDQIAANISAVNDKVTFEGLKQQFRELGIDDAAAEAMVDKLDDTLRRGASDGVDSWQQEMQEMGFPNDQIVAIQNDISAPIEEGTRAGVAKANELMQGMKRIPREELVELIRSTFDTGTVEGVRAFNSYMDGLPDKIPKSAVRERLTAAIEEGGDIGAQALEEVLEQSKAGDDLGGNIRRGAKKGAEEGAKIVTDEIESAVEDMEQPLANAVSSGFSEGLLNGEAAIGDFSSAIADKIEQAVADGTGSGVEAFSESFSVAIDQAIEEFATLASEFPADELAEKIEQGIVQPVTGLQDSLDNLDVSDFQNSMETIADSAGDIAKSKISKELSDANKYSKNTSRYLSHVPGYLRSAAGRAITLARALERAAIASNKIKGRRWSGGPVEGGQQYTVNELGREMFLSNSGRLSEITAPSNAQWTAPTSGTVVPAGLAQSVRDNAQALSVNAAIRQVNSSSISNSSTTTELGDGASRQLLRAIKKLDSSGMNQTNNIQITSSTPSKDASRMTMEMARLRLRRR